MRGIDPSASAHFGRAGETGFRVERSTDGSVFTTAGRVAANTTAWTDRHLPAERSSELWYRVRAANFDQATLGAFTKPVIVKRPLTK